MAKMQAHRGEPNACLEKRRQIQKRWRSWRGIRKSITKMRGEISKLHTVPRPETQLCLRNERPTGSGICERTV
jgi:hypothetical protein